MDPNERDRLVRLETEFKAMDKKVDDISTDVKAIREQANKWKGALGVILGLGGVIGLILGFLKDWFTG